MCGHSSQSAWDLALPAFYGTTLRIGRIRTREVTLSRVTMAPRSSASWLFWSASKTSFPAAAGSTSCVLIWSTLGPSALVAATMAAKSRSCVKTTYPCCLAQDMISQSFARGSPICDQCSASIPCAAKNLTHSGERFMSTRIFMIWSEVAQSPRRAMRQRREQPEHPPFRGKGKLGGFRRSIARTQAIQR